MTNDEQAREDDERQASTLMNLGRGAKTIALLAFLLPWVTVSCARQPLAKMTGLGLATGQIETFESGPIAAVGGSGLTDAISRNATADLYVIAAAMLIVAGLGLSFILARRTAAFAALASAILAAMLLAFDILVRVKWGAERALQDSAAANRPGGPGGPMSDSDMREVAAMIRIEENIGFWITLAALAAAALLFGVASRRRRLS